MTFKHGFAQIIKLPLAGLALVPLAMGLVGMKPTLADVARLAVGAPNPIRPAQLTDRFEAFGVVNQMLNVYHALILPAISLFVRSAANGLIFSHLLETN